MGVRSRNKRKNAGHYKIPRIKKRRLLMEAEKREKRDEVFACSSLISLVLVESEICKLSGRY